MTTLPYRRFKFYKLVRDKIPAMLQAQNMIVQAQTVENSSLYGLLIEKLQEEVRELSKATTSDEKLEELADVLEVIHALATACGTTWIQVEQRAADKKQAKGGFENGTFVEHVDVPPS